MKEKHKTMAAYVVSRYIFSESFCIYTVLTVYVVNTGRPGGEIKAPGRAGFSRPSQVTEPRVPYPAWGRFSSRTLLALEVIGAMTGTFQAKKVKSSASKSMLLYTAMR